MDTNTKSLGLSIDWETADRITVTNLKNIMSTLDTDNDRIARQIEQVAGKHLESDLEYNHNLIKSIKVVLSYFGEDDR
jgi:hypothetical protein